EVGGGPPKPTGRGCEGVREAARRGSEREGRELIGDLGVELLDRLELGRIVADEVRRVAGEPLGRRRQRDPFPEEVRQQGPQVEALGGQAAGQKREDRNGEDETAQPHRTSGVLSKDSRRRL